ncbi:hypothetical protein GTZ97_07920 [Aquabacterium fontiphilum]|uniref:hypothetical protein n=1 Tax=Aquabacterium fontiphilum TaxID=450365 RepID=UPI001376BCC3|nr:hypothetical protein [Aquabacterium fontiphilum]NBD20591.1 hypothetical protein [Aquabacterium fontiphilum]
MSHIVRNAADSGMPAVCALPYGVAQGTVSLPPTCWVLEQPRASAAAATSIHTLARVVQATSQSPGWLYQPASADLPSGASLQRIAHALQRHALVVPTHQGLPCYPIGFGAEFYSELIRIQSGQDLTRLLARYPSADVAVDMVDAPLRPSVEPPLQSRIEPVRLASRRTHRPGP